MTALGELCFALSDMFMYMYMLHVMCVHNCTYYIELCSFSPLYSQVQAVTSVGAGDFSSPLIVELDGYSEDSDRSSEDSCSSSVVGILIAVIIILLGVVGVLLAVCVYIIW